MDLNRWLNFIKGLDIDFSFDFKGLTDLPKELENAQIRFNANSNLLQYFPKKKDYYNIMMKGNKNNIFHTYTLFILIRFIYNNQYWNIPGLCLQIKAALGSEISNEQALWIALTSRNYNYYYGLTTNNCGYNRIANPFKQKKFKELIKDFEINKSVNNSFNYTMISNDQRDIIDVYFKNQDYKGLVTYFKNLK